MLPTADSSNRKTRRLKAKGWKKTLRANRNEKKAAVAIFTSDQTDFKTRYKKEDEGRCVKADGSVQDEDAAVGDGCAPHTGTEDVQEL